jgi:pimeloyl-ACP methyl ester carboxylesterase
VEPEAEDADKADVGILLVHGIGEQQRSATVLTFGDKVAWFLKRWMPPIGGSVRPAGAELAPAHSPQRELPHMRLVVDREGASLDLLLAEAWWSKEFLGLLRLLQATVIVVLGLLLQLGLVILMFASFLPKGKQLALSIQRKVARGLGDSYALVNSPGRQDAMVTTVAEDLGRFAERARRVIVIGHSQGAAISRAAILRADEPSVASLVTVGPGIAKLHQLETVLDRKGRLVAAWLLRIVAVVILDAALASASVIGEAWFFLLFIPALVVLEVSDNLVPAPRQVDAETLEVETFADRGIEWTDYYTLMDPVPEGPLFADSAGSTSESVVNRHSIRKDHTTYWGNVEQIIAPVLIAAAGAAGRTAALLADGDAERLAEARVRRNRRGYWLWVGQAATAAAAIALLAGIPGETIDAIGHWIMTWVQKIPGVPTWNLDTVVGCAVLVAGCALWYRLVIVSLWSRLQSHGTSRLFERQPERPLRLTDVALRLAILIPTLCLYAPIAAHGELGTEDGGWFAVGVPLMLMIGGTGFALLWRVAPRSPERGVRVDAGEPPT